MTKIATLLRGLLATSSALSAPLTMVCENPRRSYVVTFDERERTFVATVDEGPTAYHVREAGNYGSRVAPCMAVRTSKPISASRRKSNTSLAGS
jgi:hypothetical protein